MKPVRQSARLFAALLLAGLWMWTSAAPALDAQPVPESRDRRPRTSAELSRQYRSTPSTPSDPEVAAGSNAIVPWSRIVLESLRDGNPEIYIGNDDGSALVRVTADPATDASPSLYPSVAYVAFSSNRTGAGEIYSGNPDGSGLTRLTFHGAQSDAPAWSEDGAWIAYQTDRDGRDEIYKISSTGGESYRLTYGTGDQYSGQPAWSPDGTRIAFTAYRNNIWRIWVMNADGSAQAQLSQQPYSGDPAWSPDGTRIAYDADADGDGYLELWMMNVDGTAAQQVHDPGSTNDALAGSWSPGGRYLAFTRVTWAGSTWTAAYARAWDSQTNSTSTLWPDSTALFPDWATLDPWPPMSSVNPLPPVSPAPVAVSWAGTDTGPSGVASYDVECKEGAGGAWFSWLSATTSTSGEYPGIGGGTYYFRSRARDNAGAVEAWPADADAWTTVEALAPVATFDPLPTYLKDGAAVSWAATDPGGSGVSSYDVQYKDAATGSWTDWQMGTAASSAPFTGVGGHSYTFRVRARDRAQNLGDWSGESTTTTLYAALATGATSDMRGLGLPNVVINFLPAPLLPVRSDGYGSYSAYLLTLGTYGVTATHAGYGTALSMQLDVTDDVELVHLLPPPANLLQNGGFEQGGGTLQGWQGSGDAPPVVSTTMRHTGIAAALLGPVVPFAWGNPTTVWIGYATRPEMRVDVDGGIHIVSSGNSGSIYYPVYYDYRSPQGVWTHATIDAYAREQSHLGLAVTPAGEVHIAYPTLGMVMHTFKPVGGTWSVPVPVKDPDETVLLADGADLAADSLGRVHIVRRYQEIDTHPDHSAVAYHVWTPGVGWSPRQIVRYWGGHARIAVEPSGHPHVLVQSPYNTAIPAYCTIGLTVPGQWGCEPSREATHGSIAVSADGTVHVASTDGTYERYTRYWRRPPGATGFTVVAVPGLEGNPDVVSDSATGLVYIGAADMWYVRTTVRSTDGSWGTPQVVNTWVTENVSLAVGADGRAHIAYEDLNTIVYRSALSGTPRRSALSQSLTVPGALRAPTVAFLYLQAGMKPGTRDSFRMTLRDAVTDTVLFAAPQRDAGWSLGWADLANWTGQTVTLTFEAQAGPMPGSMKVWLDEVVVGEWQTPWVQGIAPYPIGAWATTVITLTGQNFVPGATVHMGATALAGVTLVDEHTLTAIVPPTAPGAYPLVVTLPFGLESPPAPAYVGRVAHLPVAAKNTP